MLCRYDNQINLFQRDQAEAFQEHTACGEPPQIERGYMRPNLKFIENSDDRKLAQKHWIRKHEALKVLCNALLCLLSSAPVSYFQLCHIYITYQSGQSRRWSHF